MFSRFSLIALILLGLCPTVLANESVNSEKIAPWGRVRSLSELRNSAPSAVKNDSLSQINSVDQLRDVQPNAWAYEALKSLVERYGCIVGYPDATFRGDRTLSRWEFAAGLNACLNTMEKLLQENVAVLREDIDKLKRLAQDFEAELAAVGARVDNLESQVAYLEDHFN